MKRVVLGVCVVASAALVLSTVPATAVTAAPPNIVYAETSWRASSSATSHSFDSGAFTYVLTAADLGKSESISVRTPTTAPLTLRAGTATTGVLGPEFVVGTRSLSGASGTFATSGIATLTLGSDCSGPWQATVTVLDVHRTGGALDGLAADLAVSCFYATAPTILRARTSGSLRFGTSSGTVPYGLPSVGSGWTAPSPTPWGAVREVVLPVATLGDQVTVTAVSVGQNGVAVSDDGCTGAIVTAAAPCALGLTITPPDSSSSVQVTVDVTTSDGRVTRLARALETRLPLVAPPPRPYPVAGGMWVAVEPSSVPTDTVTVRRRTPGGAWVDVATLTAAPGAGGAYPRVRDDGALPGTAYEYSTVLTSADGLFASPGSAPVTARRPVTDGVPTTRTRIALQYGGPTASAHVADTASGLTTVVDGSATGTGSGVTLQDPATSVPQGHVGTGLIPGPGVYSTGVSVTVESTQENAFQLMVVRDVLYAEDGTLLLLDASLRKPSGPYPASAEVRFRTGGGLAVPVADPPAPTVVADPSTDSEPRTITITNTGPDALTVGAGSVTGDDASSWSVTDCSSASLAAGESCTFTATLRGAVAPSTASARIDVVTTAGGTDIPVLIPVTGRTSDLAGQPRFAGAATLPHRVVISWYQPTDDGGRPVTGSQVERRADPSAPWQVVPAPGDATGSSPYAVDEDPLPAGAEYRVSVVTSRGPGAPSDVIVPSDPSPASPASAVVGTNDERRDGEPWGLWLGQLGYGARAPLQVDGHEHEAPTVTPDGSAVLVPRAETAGAGEYDYDLWTVPVQPGAAAVRLTALPGAELDPEVSPDGKRVAFTYFPPFGSADPMPQVWVMDLDGGNAQPRLTGGFSRPTWETSTRLVVSDDRTETSPLVRVTVVGPTTGSPVAIPGTAGGFDPAVSPDGAHIAFVAADGTPSQVSVPDGTVSTFFLSKYVSGVLQLPTWVTSTRAAFATTNYFTGEAGPSFVLPDNLDTDVAHLAVVPRADTSAPVIGSTTPYLRSSGEVRIAVTDDGSTRAGVSLTCTVDGVARPCVLPDGGNGVSGAGLTQGAHTLVVTARDVWGNEAAAQRTFVVDDIAPSSPSVVVPSWTRTSSATITFRSTDLTPTTYEIRQRTWPIGQSGPNGWTASVFTTATSRSLSVPSRTAVCVQVRAKDAVGLVGAWSPERCVTRPLDDKDLNRLDRGWTRVSSTSYVGGTATGISSTGRRLVSTTYVQGTQVVLLATRCPTCGSLGVYIGDTRVASVNLRSSSTTRSAVITLPRFAKRVGQLELRTSSSGLVRVDAVAILR